MTIAVSCSNCLSSYQVSNQNAGRRFKCKQCGEVCKVPKKSRSRSSADGRSSGGSGRTRKSAGDTSSRRSGAASGRSSSGRPTKRKRPVARADDYEEYDEYGADDYEEYDEYGTDDYEDYDEYGADDYDDYDSGRPARRRRPVKKKKKSRSTKSRRRSSRDGATIFHSYTANPAIWLGVPLGLAALVTLLGLVLESVAGWFFMFVLLGCSGFSVCAGIYSLVQAFREDAVCGLCYLFVPCYSFYYTVTRWDEQGPCFLTSLSMSMAIFLSLFGLFLAGVSGQ